MENQGESEFLVAIFWVYRSMMITVSLLFSFSSIKTKMSEKTENYRLQGIGSFHVGKEGACPDAVDICCTHTNDVIVVGSQGMAIFDGNGSLKVGTNKDSPFPVTRVSMTVHGTVVIDNRAGKYQQINCKKCQEVLEFCAIQRRSYGGDLNSSFCLLSTCTCKRDTGISITQEEVKM